MAPNDRQIIFEGSNLPTNVFLQNYVIKPIWLQQIAKHSWRKSLTNKGKIILHLYLQCAKSHLLVYIFKMEISFLQAGRAFKQPETKRVWNNG